MSERANVLDGKLGTIRSRLTLKHLRSVLPLAKYLIAKVQSVVCDWPSSKHKPKNCRYLECEDEWHSVFDRALMFQLLGYRVKKGMGMHFDLWELFHSQMVLLNFQHSVLQFGLTVHKTWNRKWEIKVDGGDTLTIDDGSLSDIMWQHGIDKETVKSDRIVLVMRLTESSD